MGTDELVKQSISNREEARRKVRNWGIILTFFGALLYVFNLILKKVPTIAENLSVKVKEVELSVEQPTIAIGFLIVGLLLTLFSFWPQRIVEISTEETSPDGTKRCEETIIYGTNPKKNS